MTYTTKNYTEQGGEKTVIGGVLEIKEGASITGLPAVDNQAGSTATEVAELKADFNGLLLKLKDGGHMTPDEWDLSVAVISEIPSADPHAADINGNIEKVESVTIADNVITVTVDTEELTAFPSSVAVQGTHKWVGILITTGLSDITAAKYNGYQLTAADAAESATCGGSAGDIVMWLKADEIVNTPKTFKLWSSGYAETTFTVVIDEPVVE